MTIRHAFLTLVTAALLAPAAQGAINVVDYWRMGEDDPGAVPGVATTTRDSVGTRNVTWVGAPFYATDVSPAAASHVGSSLSMNFFSCCTYGTGTLLSNVTDNFGLEAWIKPISVTGSHVIAYNGNTGSSGWGMRVNNGAYEILFGGTIFLPAGSPANNAWTHVALVRASGTATLYVNGVSVTNTTLAPSAPVGSFAIGNTPGGGTDNWSGYMDEVRFFTFAAGQFSTSDLLLNQSFVAPTIAGMSESGITTTGATVTATLNPHGLTSPVQFQYGLTTNYGSAVTSNAPALTANTVVTVSLANLAPGSLYHCRVVATNPAGATTNSDLPFTTLRGTNITVNNTGDSGAGSLRQAILGAASNAIINITATGTITLASPLPLLTNSITFNGPGAGNLTISGANAYRVFFVDTSNGVVSFNNLTIANGLAKGGQGGWAFEGGGGGLGAGGGLFVNGGQVVVSNVAFSGNSALGGRGGDGGGNGGGGGAGMGGHGGDGYSAAGGGGGGFAGQGGSVAHTTQNLGGGGGGGGIYGDGGASGVEGTTTGSSGGGGGAYTNGAPGVGATGGAGANGLGGSGANGTSGSGNSNGQNGSDYGGGGGGGHGLGLSGYFGGSGGNGGKYGGGGGAEEAANGGNGGDFGGGGGSDPDSGTPGRAGDGGFGGGGGGGSGQLGAQIQLSGAGGFGGGAAGAAIDPARNVPGAYGGTAGYAINGAGGGGGGALGAGVFVRGNATSFTFTDSSIDAGSLTGGIAGTNYGNCTPPTCGGTGSTDGSSFFLFGATNNFVVSSGSRTIPGTIGGWSGAPGTLIKSGAGTLILPGISSYAGAILVNAGTLQVQGSLANSSNTIVASGATLSGTGAVNGLTLTSGSTLSPGGSVGTLTAGNTVWTGAGNYNWQLYNATNLPGIGYDVLQVNGTLDLSAASGFKINLWTLSSSGPDVNGAATNFNSSSTYSWTIVQTTGGIVGFNPANLDIVRTASNGTSGFANTAPGSFTLTVAQNNLVLNYSIGPIVATLAATNVSTTNATLQATVNPQNAPTSVWFQYGLDTNYGSFTATNTIPSVGVASLSQLLTGLAPKTTFHFRVVAANSNGVTKGADMTFATAGLAPSATIPTVTELGSRTARLNTYVTPGSSLTTTFFEYYTDAGYAGESNTDVEEPGVTPVFATQTIANLQPGTTYHFQVWAQSTDGLYLGPFVYFTTPLAPQATTLAASSIGASNATLNASIDPGINNATAYFQYGLTTNYGNVTATTIVPSSGAARVSQSIAGLTFGTQYHFRAVATNTVGASVGADITFNTSAANGMSVLAYYRLGEADPGAVVGGVPSVTRDSAGTKDLTVVGAPVYSADVDVRASNHVGSTLSLDFTSGDSYATRPVISYDTDNFCLETWVKANDNTNYYILAYNGDTTHNGWGLVQYGNGFQGAFGGTGALVGFKQLTPGVWTHLALVRNNGTATLYADGVASGSSSGTAPIAPDGSFAIGVAPEITHYDYLIGYLDEVRCFTFPAGQFNTGELLLNASPVVPPVVVGPILSNGAVQFSFTNVPSASFTMLASTNPSLPLSNWTIVGPVTENPPGQYRFTDNILTNQSQRFYRVRSP